LLEVALQDATDLIRGHLGLAGQGRESDISMQPGLFPDIAHGRCPNLSLPAQPGYGGNTAI